MNVGVLTSGGDAPGMNPCVAQVVRGCWERGHAVLGYRQGFFGVRDDDCIPLTPKDVQGWYKLGGTELRTGRMPELTETEWQARLAGRLAERGIGGLIVIGGDGSFRGASALHRADDSLNVIGIPATIDNNIFGSDYTLGYDTALNKQMAYIDDISASAMSLPGRVFFVETLGAWDGYLPHSSVLMGMADFSVLVERPLTNEEICARIEAFLRRGERDYVLVTFAEGSQQMFEAAACVRAQLGLNVKCNLLGYQQRGGVPTALDRLHAAGFAKYAVDALDEGVRNKYLVYREGRYDYLDIACAERKKVFDRFEIA
ncbi:MAG: 6-phosphofructokinase [Fretibacterium sp.]|nr:6-phosphofructokinase [Fretibacterium sp.]